MVVALPRSLGPVPLDVVAREYHESRLSITTNPVEAGADITDHAYLEPKRLTIEPVIGGWGDGVTNGFGSTRPAAAFEMILALQETREPFDVVTGLTLYQNMLIDSVVVDRVPENSRVLWFVVDLAEVIIVDTETTPASADGGDASRGSRQSGVGKDRLASGATTDRASPTVDRGNTATPTVPVNDGSPNGTKNGSYLKQIFG